MEISRQAADSVSSYFKALTYFGYKKQTDVDKLLIFNFIEELLTGSMKCFITEDDYRYIEQALNCLYGSSCLIPYPEYTTNTISSGCGCHKIGEDNSIKFVEDDTIRVKASN